MHTWKTLFVMTACSLTAIAQDNPRDRVKQILSETLELLPQTVEFRDHTFEWVGSVMQFDGKPVKGAPYSAEAVTETIQTLADGNRIIRKNTAALYRDSMGRTRREETIGAIGPWTPGGDSPQTIVINDPVAGVNYVLEPRSKKARKLPKVTTMTSETAHWVADSGSAVHVTTHAEANVRKAPAVARKPKIESLGKRLIEGVEAEGTRTTHTIAAGEIGNERPIEVVSERWYSPELQAVVLSTRTDPRMGETTYRLTRINRTEPSRLLFEVPPDYTITEGFSVVTVKKGTENK